MVHLFFHNMSSYERYGRKETMCKPFVGKLLTVDYHNIPLSKQANCWLNIVCTWSCLAALHVHTPGIRRYRHVAYWRGLALFHCTSFLLHFPYNFLSVSNRTSSRTISLYVTSDLTTHLATVSTSVSPATLVPHYDPDTHLLFLSGKVSLVYHLYFDSDLTSHLWPPGR